MASITKDDDELDEAVAELYASKPEGANEIRAAARTLLEVASKHDAPTREEALELVVAETEYGKGTCRDWLEELSAEVTQQAIEIPEIRKRIPEDSTDPVIYEFSVRIDGEGHEITLTSDALTTETAFQQAVLERTDTLLEFNEWRDTLNGWLDAARIEEVEQEPVTPSHAVAQSILENLADTECHPKARYFRELGTTYTYYDDDPHIDGVDSPVVWVSAAMVDQVSRQTQGDIDHSRTRQILAPYLASETDGVARLDGGFRAWGFDHARLEDEGLVEDAETITARADDDDGDDDSDDDDTEDDDTEDDDE